MTKLTIVLKYPDASKLWKLWANEERNIDFRKDIDMANRCTLAYGTGELMDLLGKSMPKLELSVQSSIPAEGYFIDLNIEGSSYEGSFELKSSDRGIKITGFGRNGLLNGVYELLRIHGYDWLEPGPYGECMPEKATLDFLKTDKKCMPSFKHRMIDQYRESDDSAEFLKWLSRNRVNVVFRKPATGKIADKLGMLSRRGGHLLWKIMHPDTLSENGQSLYELHPDWFGKDINNKNDRRSAAETQLCCSNNEMLDYLSQKVCHILSTEMADIDILDLWGFDTWGNICQCAECRKLGNGSDHNLHLLSKVQEYLLKNLDRRVMINTIAYEGTVTIDAPRHKVPDILKKTGSMVIFYPISRCYKHQMADKNCTRNKIYYDSLAQWSAKADGLPLWAGEYYNVSKFEDMPLVLSRLVPAEMRYYLSRGCSGATYMHNFSPNWGVRTLLQMQHVSLAWDINTDEEKFLDRYFRCRYGRHAKKMRRTYEQIEDITSEITLWRAYGKSLLTILSRWDGTRPTAPLCVAECEDEKIMLKKLAASVRKLQKAAENINACIRDEQQTDWKNLPSGDILPLVLTPQELAKHRFFDRIEHSLGEDLRGLVYAIDTLALMLAIANYHRALRLNRKYVEKWAVVEQNADLMNSYYIPVSYENPGPGVDIKDALSRSQLRRTINRCRGFLIKNKMI